MASLNKVFLIGNLTRAPELRYTPSGTAVADLRLAVNRNYTTQSGEKREEACFLTVVVWGKQAESCGEYLDKGSQVFVEGRYTISPNAFLSYRAEYLNKDVETSDPALDFSYEHVVRSMAMLYAGF